MSRLAVVLVTDVDCWVQSYACGNFLLGQGSSVLWASRPFAAEIDRGERKQYEAGSLLVTAAPDDGVHWLSAARERFDAEFVDVRFVEGFEGLRLRPVRIGVYGGGGAPYNHARILSELGFLTDFVSPRDITGGRLSEFDALVVPGGGMLAMKGQLDPLGKEGCEAISHFVRDGGMYLGFCAGAFDAAIVADSFVAVCPYQPSLRLVNAAVWNSSDTEWIGLESPGVGVITARNLRPEHPVMVGMPEEFEITHYNGPLFEPCLDGVEGASEPFGLAAVAGFTDEFTPSEYFLRFSEYDRGAAANDDLLISRAAQEERLNIVGGYYGLGRVILFGSHPEFGGDFLGDKWGLAARMLANAAFWQASHVAEPRPVNRTPVLGTAISYPPGHGLTGVSRRLGPVMRRVERLRARSKGVEPSWLSDELAMSIFGLSGQEIWDRGLAAFDDVAEKMELTLRGEKELVAEALKLAQVLRNTGATEALSMADDLEMAVLKLEEAIHYRTPPEWHQDFGYEGVLQILDRMESQVQAAKDNLGVSLEPSSNPYQHFESSPYQLMVGVYVSALGLLTNAWLLLQVHKTRLSELVFKGRTVLNMAGEEQPIPS